MEIYSLLGPELPRMPQWSGGPSQTLTFLSGEELLDLRDVLKYDPHTVAQCMTVDDFVKLESHEGYDFLNINYFYLEEDRVEFEEIDLYVGPDYLIVILDDEVLRSEWIAFARGRLTGRQSNLHNFLYYLLFDFILDRTFQSLEALEDALQELELDILTRATKEKFQLIIERKAQINLIKKYVRPLIYVGDAFVVNENGLIRKECMKYFKEAGMRFRKLYDFTVSLGELASQIQRSYDSAVSMRESETSEKLTLVAGLVAPLTVITGIYGMNFSFMPELRWKYAYPVTLACMLAVEGFMYWLFRRRRR